jgi:hypothetical protein
VTNDDQGLHFSDLEMIMAGYDTDGTPKIGTLTISFELSPRGTGVRWQTKVVEQSIKSVEKEFTYEVRGIVRTAKDTLNNADKVSGYAILQKYSNAEAVDKGASLSLPDMQELGRTLVSITSSYNRAVGLDKQVAVLEGGRVSSIDQPRFAAPKRFVLPLAIFRNDTLIGSSVSLPNMVAFYDSVNFLASGQNVVTRKSLSLDRGIFVQCHFKDIDMEYDGGPLYFDATNVLENTTVSFGPGASNRPDMVELLQKMTQAPTVKN